MRCLLVSPDLVLLPGEKGRGFSEDLFLLLENPILAAKPTELFSLLGEQSFPLSLIDLCVLNPAMQRVVRDAKLPGYLGDALVWADGAYTHGFREWAEEERGWRVEVPYHRDRQLWRYELEEKPRGFSRSWRGDGWWKGRS